MYAIVLRSCPDHAVDELVGVLSAAFSVKEATAKAVIESAPIVLIDELDGVEAGILQLALRPMEALGAEVECAPHTDPDLPKIDWPRKPKIFKRSLESWHYDLQLVVPLGDGRQASLIDLLAARVGHATSASTGALQPQSARYPGTDSLAPHSGPMPVAVDSGSRREASDPLTQRREFQGSDLGEITPFSNPVLPTVDVGTSPTPSPASGAIGSRMDEIFAADEPGVMPSSNDIDSAFAALMGGSGADDADDVGFFGGADDSGGQAMAMSVASGPSFAVFLAKIPDPNRQKKAVPLLAELAGIEESEAATLAKKMIIPVTKGLSKDEAEQVKHRFAEIGVLARIKPG